MRITFLFLTFFFNVALIAQSADGYLIRMGDISVINGNEDAAEVPIKYFPSGEWNSGVLYTINGSSIELENVRLNLNTNEFEVKKGLHIFTAYKRQLKSLVINTPIASFVIESRYVPELDESTLSNLITLYEGTSFRLFKAIKVLVKKPNFKPVLNTGSRNVSYSTKEYFVVENGNELFVLPSKKRKAKKMLERIIDDSSIVKSNKIDVSKEDDLVKLFKLLN
ncbi:MAG: hypothetical protein ACJA1A_002049 [Saprospiraceae bacterium]|jgi:hypothetical protein|tara:strand:- start:1456 stop:2124 length:669 start_codon:yes stop_codon:yes gene_type:complete